MPEALSITITDDGSGLATAMCMEVAAQVAALGGDQVFINTGPRPDYPAPASTYLTVGFELVNRGHVYHRRIP